MKTREDKVLSLLQTGKEYSSVDLLMEGCGSEGRKIISTLRRQGYNIRDRWKRRAGSRFKVYYLVEKIVQEEVKELPKTEPLQGENLDKWEQTRLLFT